MQSMKTEKLSKMSSKEQPKEKKASATEKKEEGTKKEEQKEMQSTKNEEQTGQEAQAESSTSSNGPKPSTVDAWLFGKPKDPSDSVDASPVRSQVHANAELYDMNNKRRGIALIFNHVEFKKMAKRNGSKKDCEDICQAFGKLDFDVRVYQDPTVTMVAQALKSTAAEDHRDADCLVVVAMSHGESGLLYSSDNMYPVDMLWAPFTADRCSTLAGKPKLFFIQACRGARLDRPVKIIHETDSTNSYSIPAYADIMVAYSTYDGFYSWRNPDAGAWFIQALCEELKLNGRHRDVLTIMTFVNRRVAIEYQSYVPHDEKFHEKKQIPSIVSMLTRLVYFGEKSV